MCGIAGAYNLTQRSGKIQEQELHALKDALAHRGPDQGTILLLEQEQLGFAFARLKIQDLSDAARQPMQDPEKSITLCFNGEIYNSHLLRQELEHLGYLFTSTGDTQVVLYAYKQWGIDFLYRIEGMFAIALYDHTLKKLFLIRDRIGIKPLYFSLMGGILSWASEIKALWQLPWMEKKYSPVAAYHYLTFMVTPAPYTLFDKVYKLPAGMYAVVDEQRELSFIEWYSPFLPLTERERSCFSQEEFCLENIRTIILQSVKLRMVADVPVGAFLSGGIDSSLIVALMAQHSSRVKTFTVAFEDGPETNELNWARLVAKQFGTEHHEIILTEKEAFGFYEKMLFYLDEPLADSVCIPFYFIAKLAKEHGITVAQVGEGADELFVGYELYEQYFTAYHYLNGPLTRHLPASIKKMAAYLIKKRYKKNSYDALLDRWVKKQPLFWSGALGFHEETKKQFLSQGQQLPDCSFDGVIEKIYPGLVQGYESAAFMNYHQEKLSAAYPEYDCFQQMLYFELKHRLPELLLMRADKMSMATSVEARVPFLDHRLVEFMLHVPAALKYKNKTKKYLLKQICRGILPEVILERKKVGFATPLQRWYRPGTAFYDYFGLISEQNKPMASLAQYYKQSSVQESTSIKSSDAVNRWILQTLWAQQ